jgi:hypothetical protein
MAGPSFIWHVLLRTIQSISYKSAETDDTSCHSGIDTSYSNDVIDKGLWHEPMLDPSTASSGSLFLPIGPWTPCEEDQHRSQRLQSAAKLMRQAFIGICDAYMQHLLDVGMPQQTLNEWHRNVVNGELADNNRSTYNKMTMH